MATHVSQDTNMKNMKLQRQLNVLWRNLSKPSKMTIPSKCVIELVKKLDDLEDFLSRLDEDHMDMVMKQPEDELLRVYFYLNPEVDVKVTLGACLSEILRISAPDPPFKDGKMKIFFRLANKAYEFLPSMSGRAYTKALTILKRVTHHNSYRIMLDEGMYDRMREMFQLFLDGIRSGHSHKVRSRIAYVMSQIILECEDCDDLIVDLIVILLSSLKKENQDANPVAFKLAKHLFEKCENMITLYILDAIKRSGIPVEQYDGIVASFCGNSTGYGYIVDDEEVEVDVSQRGDVAESTPHNGPCSGDMIGKLSMEEMGKSVDSKKSQSQFSSRPAGGRSCSEKKNITIHPFEILPTKTPPELRTKRLHDISATAPSPLPTNVSLNGEASRVSDRQSWEKNRKNSGEDIEEVAVDTSQPREVGVAVLENYVTASGATPKDCPSRGKRIWKPNYRMKPEEGYQHIWMNKPRSRKEKEGDADLGFNSKESDSLFSLKPMDHFEKLPTATTLSPLFKTVSSNAETHLGQVSDRQHRKKEAEDSGESSNSQPRSIYQGFKFGEVPNTPHQKKKAIANDKEAETLLSLSTNISSDEEAQLEKILDQEDQNNNLDAAGEKSSSKRKETTIKEEQGTYAFVFGKNLKGPKSLGSTSRSRSSKPKAKPRKDGVQQISGNSGRPGPELVGERIQVLRPKDKMFYEGSVTSYNPRNKKHSVDYDDGDSENI